MIEIHQHQLPKTDGLNCPNCNKLLDGASNVRGSEAPYEGCITICVYCSSILEMKGKGSSMHYETVSSEELEKLKKEDPEAYQSLQVAREIVKQFKKSQ